MEFRNGIVLAVFTVLMTICIFGESKPFHHHDMDKVDVCLFTCDYCFKGHYVVECANECLAMEGVMGPLWSRTCPFFQKHSESEQEITNVNPFK